MKMYKIYKLASKKASPQQISDNNMFGPLYHGTTEENRGKIEEEGFKIFIGPESSGNISHGYGGSNYHNSIPAPVHHLGYGIYFSTVKNIAKQFAGGTVRGMKEYYLDSNSVEIINFGSPRTMMEWWVNNGYDADLAQTDRVSATMKMTEALKSRYDAVWFKGKGINRLLDGDQVCVFDLSKIYEVNKVDIVAGEIGSKVKRLSDGMMGVLVGKLTAGDVRAINNPNHYLMKYVNDGVNNFYSIKWKKGAYSANYLPETEIEFL